MSDTETVRGSSRILESLDNGVGYRWLVRIVEAGISRNRKRYLPTVLQEAVPLYEGVKAFDGHRSPEQRTTSKIRGLVGSYRNPRWNPDTQAIEAELTLIEHVPEAETIRHVLLRDPDLIGISHDVTAEVAPVREGGRSFGDVRKIVSVESADVVADPSAGGRVERLVASVQREEGGVQMDPKQKRKLDLGLPEDASDEELLAAILAHEPEIKEEEQPEPPEVEGVPVAAEQSDPVNEEQPVLIGATTESVTTTNGGNMRTDTLEGPVKRLVVRSMVQEANLPEETKNRLIERFDGYSHVTESDVAATIREATELWAEWEGKQPKQLPGQNVEVREGKNQANALDGFFLGYPVDGVKFRSIKEAYGAITGLYPHMTESSEEYARMVLAHSVGAISGRTRVAESVASTTFAQALGDSITRVAQRLWEDNTDMLNSWQVWCNTEEVADFRTQRRFRVGGYNSLPTVAEGNAYTALTTPADEEATFAVSKKGGTEDWTFEAITNDDRQVLAQTPRKLVYAAKLGLHRAVYLTTLEGNPATTYDATALFHATHNNLLGPSNPISSANLGLLRNLVVQQTQLSQTEGFIGGIPRYLIHPTNIQQTAFELTESAVAVTSNKDATVPNQWRGLDAIEVPLLAADDYYVVIDPATGPSVLTVGFLDGRMEPELFTQDAATVGTVFTNDKVTWKVRHIWGISIDDHRGAAKGDAAV